MALHPFVKLPYPLVGRQFLVFGLRPYREHEVAHQLVNRYTFGLRFGKDCLFNCRRKI